jgi:ketosteroid isomerase-like protein
MTGKQKSFTTFLKGERAAAANAYAAGNAAPVSGLSATRDPATFLGPGGGIVSGARRVIATNERGAKSFAPGGRSAFKIVQAAAADWLGFWTGIQLAKVRLPGKRSLVPMKLRVTEVFRREKRGWKLIHRHADLLAKRAAKK